MGRRKRFERDQRERSLSGLRRLPARSDQHRCMRISDFTVSSFGGQNTVIKDTKSLKPGIATDAKNWLTGKFGDHIERRRGSALLGQTRQSGAGKITGLGVGIRYDGVQVPFFSYGRKVKYYDATTADTIEVGSNLLASAQDGADCWFSPYQNL